MTGSGKRSLPELFQKFSTWLIEKQVMEEWSKWSTNHGSEYLNDTTKVHHNRLTLRFVESICFEDPEKQNKGYNYPYTCYHNHNFQNSVLKCFPTWIQVSIESNKFESKIVKIGLSTIWSDPKGNQQTIHNKTSTRRILIRYQLLSWQSIWSLCRMLCFINISKKMLSDSKLTT